MKEKIVGQCIKELNAIHYQVQECRGDIGILSKFMDMLTDENRELIQGKIDECHALIENKMHDIEEAGKLRREELDRTLRPLGLFLTFDHDDGYTVEVQEDL